MAEVNRATKWVFYYDGECGFCILSVRALALADFFRMVTWIPYQGLLEPPEGLTWEDLDAAAYLAVARGSSGTDEALTVGRRLYRGFYAFRMLALRLPPLVPLVPLIWLPGISPLGERAYGWITANRYRISRRCRLKAGR